METIAPGTTLIDVEHLGTPQVIASCLLEGNGTAAIVDPGPASALPVLKSKLARRGLSVADLETILLTHIHLDHAGATGTLVKENPRLRVMVHERGAVHMAHPAHLLESATRLYGTHMGRLWGEFLAVPQGNLHALKGGEKIQAGGRTIEVIYSPGHASHHVCYWDAQSGTAFVGDTGGIRIANRPFVVPPTPPPDIDLELWRQSLEQIAARKPARLFLTHFGAAQPVDTHIAELQARLEQWARMVQASLERDGDDASRADEFARTVEAEMRNQLTASESARYAKGAALEQCWQGLARYWRKKSS